MLIAGFPAGPWGTNCYVAATGPGTECVVIDPGKDAAEGVAEVVREHNLKPVAVLVTHGHVDHMWCVAPVSGTYDATAWIHPRDRHLLSDPLAGMSPVGIRINRSRCAVTSTSMWASCSTSPNRTCSRPFSRGTMVAPAAHQRTSKRVSVKARHTRSTGTAMSTR